MKYTILSTFVFLVILTASIFVCFYKLDSAPVARWDESTNIEVVHELLKSDTPLVLTLNSKPFFEKPPLWYWSTAFVNRILGKSVVSMRIISAVSGVLIIMILFWYARSKYGLSVAIANSTILLCIPHLYRQNPGGIFSTHTLRSADLDSLFILLIVLAWISFSLTISQRMHWVIIGSLCTGLAILTKGPLGILPVIIFIVTNLPHCHRKPWSYKHIIITLVVVLTVILLPWYLYMILSFKTLFLQAHLGYHILERVMTPIEGHKENPWFYIQILANPYLYPFGILSYISIMYYVIDKHHDREEISLLIFIIVILGVTSLTQTKLAWYLLPVYPFLSLFTARRIVFLLKDFIRKRL
jgi:4-amino-4-deoxy-L-arabinose transferase-like glycosyltransferase